MLVQQAGVLVDDYATNTMLVQPAGLLVEDYGTRCTPMLSRWMFVSLKLLPVRHILFCAIKASRTLPISRGYLNGC